MMAELVDEGKVRWIGVCNHDVEQLERVRGGPPRRLAPASSSRCSLAARARTLLPWAAEHGTGVIAYSPMASGLLTGAFDHDRVERLDPDDWRRESPIFQEPALAGEPRARRRASVRLPSVWA